MGKILSSAEKAAKIATFLLILGGPLQAMAENNREGDPEDNKNRIEDARLALGKIIPFVEKNDHSLRNTLGNTDVKTFTSDDGKELVMAVDKSFVILSIGDGHYTYLDKNSDGVLDRVVINNEENSEDRGLVKNGLYVFNPMDNLFREVAAVADLKPEKIKAISFDLGKGTVSFVDAEDGSSGTVDGDQAQAAIKKFQDKYSENLQQMVTEQVK